MQAISESSASWPASSKAEPLSSSNTTLPTPVTTAIWVCRDERKWALIHVVTFTLVWLSTRAQHSPRSDKEAFYLTVPALHGARAPCMPRPAGPAPGLH